MLQTLQTTTMKMVPQDMRVSRMSACAVESMMSHTFHIDMDRPAPEVLLIVTATILNQPLPSLALPWPAMRMSVLRARRARARRASGRSSTLDDVFECL